MTDLDKKIIELIEPYMDKTLSEGCIVTYYPEKGKNGPHIGVVGDLYKDPYSDRCSPYNLDDIEEEDIIGHCDITSVLKYIANVSNFNYEGRLDINEIHIYNFETNNEDYYIPNKPIHLYSEQEKKDLIELLEKLGK